MKFRRTGIRDAFFVVLIYAIGLAAIAYLFYLLITDFTRFIATLIGFIVATPILIIAIGYVVQNPIWYRLIIPLCVIAFVAVLDEIYPEVEVFEPLKYVLFFGWIFWGFKRLTSKNKDS